ncbi:MAG: DEAD/DEAH box helicase [Deltaproteobacteria bacterium]|jgi:superfamily II DNA or RNA helicase|nr:DEAD/DEAH box helicase [Deltaproteobacteria bacterium]
MEFTPGMRIVVRGEEWMVKKAALNTCGKHALYCLGVSSLVKDKEIVFLEDLENIEPVDPAQIRFVIDDSARFQRSRFFVESHWRRSAPTETDLHIGHEAAMDTLNFQLEPAARALKMLRPRILIADAVGLGKTLEAGILMSELIARGKGKRILVVTVKSMLLQFQKEIWNRFAIPLVRLDSSKIQKIRAKLVVNHNHFFHFNKTIVSIDTLKRDREYRQHLENARWDIIVIDEAHNVAERGEKEGQRTRLAKLLEDKSEALIMLSATPHDGRSKSFASLMNILNPTAIADPENYTKEEVGELCIRRLKKDVKDEIIGAFKERSVFEESCLASALEEVAFDVLAELNLEMDQEAKRRGYSGALFKTILEKSLFSSPAACLKSIDERLKKLIKKYGDSGFSDINKLKDFRAALEKIEFSSFSRYQSLLNLLKSQAYDWSADRADDRIVIFTERLETMNFLKTNLINEPNLNLSSEAVEILHGAQADYEQQAIVEDFGRRESPVRVLIATDVASEGINLHYLCHRLIHFDIPWSLMVFQQRNGRIDRYGQERGPDIRYLKIKSNNPKIFGDLRILEILVDKEKQAYKNIGDSGLLMGKFSVEEEELATAEAIEKGLSAESFSQEIDRYAEQLDPFEALMSSSNSSSYKPRLKPRETFFNDIDFLENAFSYFAETDSYSLKNLSSVEGVEIGLSGDLADRLNTVLPEEIRPQDGFLRLSPDKKFCLQQMKLSLQNNLSGKAWPTTHYLWAIHPIFEWLGDKCSLLFNRDEAPLIGLKDIMSKDEIIFITEAVVTNRSATPTVDIWFGLRYLNGKFVEELSMEDIISKTGYGRKEVPNSLVLTEQNIRRAESLLKDAIFQANQIISRHKESYRHRINPLLKEEIKKLNEFKDRRIEVIKKQLLNEGKKSEDLDKIMSLFKKFSQIILNGLSVEDKPYLRIMAALMGA